MEQDYGAGRARSFSVSARKRKKQDAQLRVRVGTTEFPVTKISDQGFVIAAEGRPPLRGYADIFRGDEHVRFGLVTCAWTEGGSVGYEFKHSSHGQQVAADYAP